MWYVLCLSLKKKKICFSTYLKSMVLEKQNLSHTNRNSYIYTAKVCWNHTSFLWPTTSQKRFSESLNVWFIYVLKKNECYFEFWLCNYLNSPLALSLKTTYVCLPRQYSLVILSRFVYHFVIGNQYIWTLV